MLYLWMPETDGVWYWSTGENWVAAVSIEQLIHDIQPYQSYETTVYFSSRYIQLIQQKISKANYKQLGQEGIRYLLEEYMTLPIDQVHVMHHFHSPDRLTVLGVSQSTITMWQQSLSLLPIKLIALLPDFLLLPVPVKNQTVIAHIQHQTLIRFDEWGGASTDDLAVYLELNPVAESYRYTNLTPVQLDALKLVTTEEQRESYDYQFHPTVKAKQHPFNVLPKPKKDLAVSSYWKACAVVFVLLLMVQFSYDLLRWIQLRKVADQTVAQSISQYKDWFGENSRVTEQNIKSMFQSQLRMNQTGDTNALNLLSRVGPILMQRQVTAQQVSYEANVLTMQLKANSSDSLQSLTQQLNQQGFKAELGQVQANGAGSIGIVKIQ